MREIALDEGRQQGLHQRNADPRQHRRQQQPVGLRPDEARRASNGHQRHAQRDPDPLIQPPRNACTRQRADAHHEHGQGGQQAGLRIGCAGGPLDHVQQRPDGGQGGPQVQRHGHDGDDGKQGA